MTERLNREMLLDWFDEFDPQQYSGEALIHAYNGLTGANAALVCTHCGEMLCLGLVETRMCPWFGINDCRKCGSKERGYCRCEVACNE